jgi:hypothetical protein
MKYIFVAGAPGSKWSSVVKNIYYSNSIDQSDYRDDWTYYHDASGKLELMHLGAYFDPGMACVLPEYFNSMTKFQAERIFDQPFDSAATGVRIIKSHVFSYFENIEYLRQNWPDSPIVLVHRDDDACLGWWVKCGHFDITYPSYYIYYKDLKTMASIIQRQNQGIKTAHDQLKPHPVYTNDRLALMLGISHPPTEYQQNYTANNIDVRVIV